MAVRYHGADELRAAFISSLSQGGVFIKTSQPLAIGSEILMEIELEGDLSPIRIKGRVVWDRLVGREDGMGVAFSESLPDRLRKLLTEPGS
jgi:type IV pilus assembly protein PilZ